LQNFSPGWLWIVILLISASWVASITGVSYPCPLGFFFYFFKQEYFIGNILYFYQKELKSGLFSFCDVCSNRSIVWITYHQTLMSEFL
jgi:hypothetical protein